LITYIYWESAQELSGKFWLQYMSRRVARIYPLYLFLLAFTFLIPVILWHEPWPKLATVFLNVTLIKGFFAVFNFSGIAPSWSLTVEETFYLLAPILFLVFRKYGPLAVLTLAYAVGGVLEVICSKSGFYGIFGNFTFMLVYTFFGRAFEFVAGMALARGLLANPKAFWAKGRISFTYLGLVGSIFTVYWLSLLRRGSEFGLFHPIGLVLNNFVLPVFVCILYRGLITEQSIFSRLLGSRLFVFLGRSSYAFYLVHFGILAAIIQTHLTIANELARVAVLFVLVNLVSSLLFLTVEHPANHLVRHWGDGLVKKMGFADAPERGRPWGGYAVAWSGAVVAVFLMWCVVSFDWLRPALTAMQPAQSGLRGGPDLGRLISARTDYLVVTAQVGQVASLTYKVAGIPIASDGFIFAHAKSRMEFDISLLGRSTFEFSSGLDDVGGADHGSVTYVVRGDGRTLFESPVVRALEAPHRYSVDVTGVQRLELIVTDAGDGIQSDEAYWIRPVLR
jgi:peptidoglycan/LPS O-acetylase OafA/YrhL